MKTTKTWIVQHIIHQIRTAKAQAVQS